MKRFEPTEALNRVIDRSDEMAWGFTFQLLHPFSFFSLSSPSITDSSTAEFHLYVNEMEENRPAISQQPAAFPSLTTSTIRAEYRHHRNVNASHCRRVEKVRSLKRHPTPLTPELRASGLKQPPHHCALWWHSPVYLLQGKMGNTCRIGRDVLRGGMGGGGGQSTKCCAVAESQKCLALSVQSGSDSSRVIFVRPKAPRLIFESAPSPKEW